MYAIYGNIYHQYTPNVSICTIHGSYGYCYKNIKTSSRLLALFPSARIDPAVDQELSARRIQLVKDAHLRAEHQAAAPLGDR